MYLNLIMMIIINYNNKNSLFKKTQNKMIYQKVNFHQNNYYEVNTIAKKVLEKVFIQIKLLKKLMIYCSRKQSLIKIIKKLINKIRKNHQKKQS